MLSLFQGSQALAEPRFGLWVEAEGVNQPFRSAGDFAKFLEFSGKWQFTDLFCQVYRGDRAWFSSQVSDAGPYRIAQQSGFDPLGDTIRQAHARGQKVHAWVNVLRAFNNAQSPLFKRAGYEAALVDSIGNSLLQYDERGAPPAPQRGWMLETPGTWLDPASETTRQYLVEVMRELVTNYPQLDGVHLDMIRFPFSRADNSGINKRVGFGYSLSSVRKFFQESGRTPVKELTPALINQLERSKAWRAWRKSQVTLMVFEIRQMLRQQAPQMELSAAVIAEQQRALLYAFQDWPLWSRAGVVDTVIPMNYTKDEKLFARISREALEVAAPPGVLIGLGAWLMLEAPQQLEAQTTSALRQGARGINVFSYSNLFSPRGATALDRIEAALKGR